MIADILFFIFAAVLLVGALGVATAKNPVHSVLFLVLCFFNAAGLFLLIGAEFIGLLLIMVYVGAIAVMFLFVLMTVDLTHEHDEKRHPFFTSVAIGVGLVLFVEIIVALLGGIGGEEGRLVASMPMDENVQNITQLGRILFTNYLYPFITVSMVLLVGMVGAIVLAHRKREDVNRQDIPEQISRKREDSIELVTPPLGKGVS